MNKIKLVFMLFLILICSIARAENDYEFNSKLAFHHEQTIQPGVMDSYSLNENANVKLIIGMMEGKDFLSEIKNMSEADMSEKFLEKTVLIDQLDNITNRFQLELKKVKTNDQVLVQLKYLITKNNESWIEVEQYVVAKGATAFSSVRYPEKISNQLKLDIQEGMENFKLIKNSPHTVFNKVKYQFTKMYAVIDKIKLEQPLKIISSLVIDQAFADVAKEKYGNCNNKKYVKSGEFTTKPGSALFNFKKILEDIENEAAILTVKESNKKEKVDYSRINCLTSFYKEAKQNAADYWAKRGKKEGCIENDNIISEANDTCSDSTLTELKKSLAYVNKIDSDFQMLVSGEMTVRIACEDTVSKAQKKELSQFKELGASTQQAFCCSQGNGNKDEKLNDKGPLYLALESDDESFKNASLEAKTQMCLKKTNSGEGKYLSSAEGIADCLQNMGAGAEKMWEGLKKAASSLFDLKTYVAIGRFISDMPDSGKKLIEVVGEKIAAQLYSITDCMSPYEGKQYICKQIPAVLSTLLGPGMFKSIVTKIVDKASQTALAEAIGKAVAESKTIQNIKSKMEAVSNVAGRLTKPIANSKYIKPSLNVLAKISKILGKDISTPLKEKIISSVKKLKDKAVATSEKILKKPAVAEEVAETAATEATKKAAFQAAKESATDMVQGADGVYRPATPTDGKELVVNQSGTPATAQAPATAPTQLPATAQAPATAPTQLPATAQAPATAPTQLPAPTQAQLPATGVSKPGNNLVSQNHTEMVSDIDAYKKAVASGDETLAAEIKSRMHERAKKLSDSDRVSIAREINGKELTDPLKVIDAHNVGGPGRELGTYSSKEIAEKARLAKKAGLTKEARKDLMNAGVLGGDSAPAVEFISFNTPQAGRIPGRILSSDGYNFKVEYINPNTGDKFIRDFTGEQLRKLEVRASENSRVAFNGPSPSPKSELDAAFDQIEKEAKAKATATNTAQEISRPVQPITEPVPAPAPLGLAYKGEEINAGSLVQELDGRVARAAEVARAENAGVKTTSLTEASVDVPVPAPAPLGLAYRGKEINAGSLVQELDGRVARAAEASVDVPVPAPAPLGLAYRGKEINAGSLVQELDRRAANANRATEVARVENAGVNKGILEARRESAIKPDYVNPYGVAKSDLQVGSKIKVKVSTLDGVKEVEGELLTLYTDSVTGMPHAQIKYADGVITERGNVLQGKPNHQVTNVDISSIEGVRAAERPPVLQAPPVAPKKPLGKTAKGPEGESLDPDTYSGKKFRQNADQEAADILIKEYRLGESSHIDQLKKEINDAQWIRKEALSRDSNTNYVSKNGNVNDSRFDPKIYYAHQAEEYHSAMNSAKKVSANGITREEAEREFKGVIQYDANNNPIRKRSARDTVAGAIREKGSKAGKSEEVIKQEIASMNEWMDKYDRTIPLQANVEKATKAQQEFQKLKPKLEAALSGSSSQPLAQSHFEEISRNMRDMMLKPEQKEAAEAALRRIKCARPEWKISDSYNGFNLRCD